jgi:hypothetical protein
MTGDSDRSFAGSNRQWIRLQARWIWVFIAGPKDVRVVLAHSPIRQGIAL